MQVEVEEKTTEYYMVSVEKDEYVWKDMWENRKLWDDIDRWCEQTFGEQGVWGGHPSAWKRMGPTYYFQHERDRAWFVLRWI